MIERYAGEPLSSEGTLTLASDPPGADVRLYRYEEIDGVLEPSDERHLGQTPLAAMTLAMGRYLCILKKDGFRETRYPVHITRQRVWSCSAKSPRSWLTQVAMSPPALHATGRLAVVCPRIRRVRPETP